MSMNSFKLWSASAWLRSWEAIQPALHRSVEGGMVIFVCYLSWHAFKWSFGYAEMALVGGKVDIGVAAVIGAILTPLSTLQGFVLSKYILATTTTNVTETEKKP